MTVAEEPPPPPTPPTTSETYVDVGKALPSWSTWSNDPADMQLDIYFNTDPSKEQADRCRHTRLITGRPTIDVPGLAEQFGLPGLKPVIVLPSSALGGKYLLTDQTGAYFLWNELQPELWRFKFEGSTISLLEVITLVSTENYGNTDLVQQFNPDIAGRSRRAG